MSSNPMINSKLQENIILEGKPMTIQGTVNKSLLLTGIVILATLYTWNLCATGFSDKAYLLTIVGSIAGLILAIITCFRPKSSSITAPMYALCEGLFVGSISYMYESFQQGIVANAVGITLITLLSVLSLYKLKILQATPQFKKIIFTATCAIAIFYFIGFIAALLNHPITIFNGSLTGIIISVVICAVAALNLVIDFDFIENGERNCLPDYFEWYGGFALLVTVIWIYIEVLKLLAQLSRKD